MSRLRASIIAAFLVAFILPTNAWAVVRVTLDLPGGTGDLSGFPLQLPAGATSADLEFIAARQLLIVPGLFDNRLTAYRLDGP